MFHIAFVGYIMTALPCPKSHPYAFKSGRYCCEHTTDKYGDLIEIESQSCRNDAYKRCPKSKCKHYKG